MAEGGQKLSKRLKNYPDPNEILDSIGSDALRWFLISSPVLKGGNVAVDKEGKESITHFKVLRRYDKYTLLEVKIDTGRTHQIRVHMAEIGHPVIGDEVYSNGKNEFNVKGQMLHAKSLDFEHPITGKKMHLEAELPDYFKKVIDICEERLKRGE